jgi:hypothetical protein
LHIRDVVRVVAKYPRESHLPYFRDLNLGEGHWLVLVGVKVAIAAPRSEKLVGDDAPERGTEQRLSSRFLRDATDDQVDISRAAVDFRQRLHDLWCHHVQQIIKSVGFWEAAQRAIRVVSGKAVVATSLNVQTEHIVTVDTVRKQLAGYLQDTVVA